MRNKDILEEVFFNPNSFSIMITEIANNKNQTCMDALLDYCESNELDVEEAIPYISQALKDQIEKEAKDLNLLKTSRKKLDV